MTESYYEVLGVAADASQEEVEDAYRVRVKETHPDLNNAADAAEQFRAVQEAHETLGDPDERARYDRLGHGSYTSFGFGGDGPEDEFGFGGGTVDGFGFDAGEGGTADGVGFDPGGDPFASAATEDGGRTYDFSETTWEDATASAGGTASGSGRDRGDAFEAAAEERRTGNRRHVRDDGDGATGETDGGFAVHGWEDDPLDTPTLGLTFTQDQGVVAAIVFVLYPVFLYSSVSPLFSTLTNVLVGICTLLTMGYLLTLPELGLLVFGAWSVIAPVFLLAGPWNPLGPLALFVLAVCWIPFGYSVMVARVTRWS